VITFSVKNYEKFQHYKDRNPPWIKLYNSILDDYAYAKLPDASKAHLLAIFLLASRSNNQIPADAAFIQGAIHATEPVDLGLLQKAGFLICDHDLSGDSPPLAPRKQDAPQRERERQSSVSKDTDAKPSPDLKAKLFGDCRQWLEAAAAIRESNARSIIGKWIAQFGEGAVLQAFIHAQRQNPVGPVAWISKTLTEGKKRFEVVHGGRPAGKRQDVWEAKREDDAAFERWVAENGGGS
jgi:hypothetical protein